MQVVIAILVGFILLCTFMEDFAILVLTVPLIQPILELPGVDQIWFGVLTVIVLEMALISPRVGVKVLVVKGIAPNVTLCSPRRPMHGMRRRHDSVRRNFPTRPQPASRGVASSTAAPVPRTSDICAKHGRPTATLGDARTMLGPEAAEVRSND